MLTHAAICAFDKLGSLENKKLLTETRTLDLSTSTLVVFEINRGDRYCGQTTAAMHDTRTPSPLPLRSIPGAVWVPLMSRPINLLTWPEVAGDALVALANHRAHPEMRTSEMAALLSVRPPGWLARCDAVGLCCFFC